MAKSIDDMVKSMLAEIDESAKPLDPKTIIRNSIKTPDGTEIVSATRHDFVSHTDANGKTYSVDGGKAYLRRVGDYEDCTETSVYLYHGHAIVRDVFTWGTRGKDGSQALERVKLKDMDTAHIQAIIDDCYNVWSLMQTELEWRTSAIRRKIVRKKDIERLQLLMSEQPDRTDVYMELCLPIVTEFNNNEFN